MILARYILTLVGPSDAPAEEGSAEGWRSRDERAVAAMPRLLAEAEENLSDLLPEGYLVRIEVKE